MKTKDLLWCDLDAKWTPNRQLGRYGLQLDSPAARSEEGPEPISALPPRWKVLSSCNLNSAN
jgi:hypothetical protein